MRNVLRVASAVLVSLVIGSCKTTEVVQPTLDQGIPTVTIQSPDPTQLLLTNQSSVTLSGTASDNVGVDRVEWSSDAGTSGTANGTVNWTITNLPLESGLQVVTVTAYDAAGNAGTAEVSVRLDAIPPTVSVTVPATSGSYDTVDPTVTISGSTSDDFLLDRVDWSASSGASGTIGDPETWEIADLALGRDLSEVHREPQRIVPTEFDRQ